MSSQTKISFLEELGESLLDAAWREQSTTAKPKPHRAKRRALAAAAVLIVLAGAFAGRAALRETSGMSSTSMARPEIQRAENSRVYANPTAPSDAGTSTSGDVWENHREEEVLQAQGAPVTVAPGTGVYAPVEAAGPSSDGDPGSGGGSAPAPIEQIIKTGEVSLIVARGDFAGALSKAEAAAADHGGYVQSSSTNGDRSGTITIRVPAANFESTLAALQALGHVESQSSSGQDVSSQFVDLQARLKIAEQRVDVVSRLMKRARGISEVLRYRDVLEDAQLEVEHLKGNLRVLKDRSGLGTITVSLREDGVSAGSAGISGAVSSAWSGLSKVVETLIVALGYLLPLILIAAAAWWIIRRRKVRADVSSVRPGIE